MQNYTKNLFIILYFVCLSTVGYAQTSTLLPKNNYEKNYFRWPINAKIGLAANFGELRPNHYHMGLDCRSDQAENKDIYAAADGYVTSHQYDGFGKKKKSKFYLL